MQASEAERFAPLGSVSSYRTDIQSNHAKRFKEYRRTLENHALYMDGVTRRMKEERDSDRRRYLEYEERR